MMEQLKDILTESKISYRVLGNAITQQNGKPLSAAAVSQIVNRGQIPSRMPFDLLKRQITTFLKQQGISKCVDWTALQPSTDDDPDNGAGMLAERRPLTQAAVKHFKVKSNPFANDVLDKKDLYLGKYQQFIQQTLVDTAIAGGFVALIGASGSGKSILTYNLKKECAEKGKQVEIIKPSCIDKPRINVMTIYHAILLSLAPNEKIPQKVEHQARKAERLLKAGANTGVQYVLLIEDAQDLHFQTLLSLKAFWEIQDGYKKLLSIILIGQPELDGILDESRSPTAERLIKRIEKVIIEPYSAQDLEEYLTFKFNRVGLKLGNVFTDDGLQAMHEALAIGDGNGGVRSACHPLTINNFTISCMNCVTADAGLGFTHITAKVVEEVRNG